MNEQGLFTSIRTQCARVAAEARYVRIDHDRLAAVASTLTLGDLPAPTYDLEHHFLGSPADTVAYLLTLDTINFGSGWFPHLRKRPGMSGYFTIASSLTDRFLNSGPWSPTELQGLTAVDCAVVFGQGLDDSAIVELMALFARALNDLGAWLERDWNGDVLAPLEAANGSAETLAGILQAMPMFRDITAYHGFDVPLMKRAQLLTADLALAFSGAGPGAFGDRDRLTIFADNLVPHVLRVDGMLAYAPDLLDRIEREELIPAGSAAEVEIRAVALHAVELLVGALRARGIETSAAELDFLLWNRGQQAAYKAHPRHRTRTIYY